MPESFFLREKKFFFVRHQIISDIHEDVHKISFYADCDNADKPVRLLHGDAVRQGNRSDRW